MVAANLETWRQRGAVGRQAVLEGRADGLLVVRTAGLYELG